MKPLLVTVLVATLVKGVVAALWPLRAEEAVIWAHASWGVGSFAGDAATRVLAAWADGGSLGRLVLRAPGLVAAALWALPLARMASTARVTPRRAAGAWLTLHALPGLALATAGWSREPLLVLLTLTALDAALRWSAGDARAGLQLGVAGGLGLLVHPLALLLPLAGLGCRLDGATVTEGVRASGAGIDGRARTLLGLAIGAALALILDPSGVLPRNLAGAGSLRLGFRPTEGLRWALGAAVVVGPVLPLLATRGWRECSTLSASDGLGPRMVSIAPLAVLLYLALQGPADPRLVLGPATAALVPALLAADPPRRVVRQLRAAGLVLSLFLAGVELSATASPRLAARLEERLPALAEASAAARPLAAPLTRALRERFPEPAPYCDRDVVRGALVALRDPARRPLLAPDGAGDSPPAALTLVDHPQGAREPLRDWSTIEVEPALRIPTGGGGIWTIWPAWARDPQRAAAR